jgi:hypothetical protein
MSVMLFNISFTSGSISGFVLFAQTVDSMKIYTTRRYDHGLVFHIFTSIYEVVYGFFNLNFFGIDSLSYCLLKSTNALDIIAIKYVTIAYSVVLIAATVLVMNRCVVAWKYRTSAHGLSAFLILCYAQCTQESIRLLLVTQLYGTNASQRHVYYNGEITMFSLAHLPYAVPALFCLLLIVIPPPVILLWQPLGRHLLSRCGLGESVFVQVVDKVLLVNKLKPVLDSFQSCFKDNRRYFAGLHFVYRLALCVALLVGSQFHIVALVHSAVMLLLHAILQPYKKGVHNMLNSFFFSILLFSAVISLSINTKLMSHDGNVEHYIMICSVFRLLLLYVPILCIIGYCVFYMTLYLWQKRPKKATIDVIPDISYRRIRSVISLELLTL